jgi:ATP-dependent exoDNAse (exonuclease V) beta subunit
MNFVPADQAAREAAKNSLAETTFIAAGAGTGKTTTIVSRIVNAVCEPGGEFLMQKLVAITFTERAAAELRSRVRRELERRSVAGDVLAKTALSQFESAQIGTIHAFAKRILSSFPIEAGLPLTFEVQDQASSKLTVRESASRFVDAFFATLNESDFDLLHESGVGPAKLREFFIELNDKRLLVNEQDVLSGRQVDAAKEIKEFMTELNSWFEARKSEWSGYGASLVSKLEQGLSDLNAAYFASVDLTAKEIKLLQDLLKTLTTPGNSGGGAAKPFRDEMKEKFAGGLKGLESVDAENLMRSVLPYIWKALQNEVAIRFEQGQLTFDDLIALAVELIEGNPDVQSKLHQDFNLIVIDEFQDTDPLQWRLASLITTSNGQAGPDQGSLVLVGDAQQSIYSFRGADVATYLSVADQVGVQPMGGIKQTLQVNFRSNQMILNWVNAAFGHDSVELGTPFVELLPADTNVVQPDHSPGVAVIGSPGDGKDNKEESAYIASAAFRAKADGWTVFDHIQDKKVARAASYADMVILIPARTTLEDLLDELSVREIPYRSSDSAIVFDRPLVRGLVDALKVVAGVSEPLDMWFALKSPLFGCDDFELLTYKRLGGTWVLPYGDPTPELAATRVYQCLAMLASIRREVGSLKPAAAMLRVFDETRLASTYDQTPRGRFELECVQMVVRQARSWSNSGGLGVVDYLGWLSDQLSEDARESLPETDDRNDDAVRISTVHGVKGLEFPIVFLAGMARDRNVRMPMISVKDNRFEFKLGDITSIGFSRVSEDIEKTDRKTEQTRVLYVAATRAKDHLVVSNMAKEAKDGSTANWSGLFREAVAATVELGFAKRFDQLVHPVAEPVLTVEPAHKPESAEWLAMLDDIRAKSRAKSLVTPSSMISTEVDASPADDITTLVDEEDSPRVAYVDDEIVGSDVAKLGNAFHLVMEFVVNNKLETVNEAVEMKIKSALEEYEVGEHYDRLVKMLENMLASDIIKRIYAADQVWPELEISEVNTEGLLVEGFADLVIREGDSLVVFDYKTNLQLDEVKMAKYAQQLGAYSQIIQRATSRPVAARFLIHVLPEKVDLLAV